MTERNNMEARYCPEPVSREALETFAGELGLERFREGRFIDESVAAGVAH